MFSFLGISFIPLAGGTVASPQSLPALLPGLAELEPLTALKKLCHSIPRICCDWHYISPLHPPLTVAPSSNITITITTTPNCTLATAAAFIQWRL